MGKEKVQFTLTFYLKQNKKVQLDLQRFVIFIFSSLLPSLLPGKMLEEKLTDGFLRFGIDLFHINACSLNKNFDDLQHLLKCTNEVFDIVAVSET